MSTSRDPRRIAASGHVADSRPNRPAPPLRVASANVWFAMLDELLLKLSLPVPTGRGLAVAATESLDAIRADIADALDDPGFPPELRGGFGVLLTRCDLVLAYWPGVLAGLSDESWSQAQAAALTGDLTEVVRAGAELRGLISPPNPDPAQVAGSYPPFPPAVVARHRRVHDRAGKAAAGGYGGAAVAAAAQLRPDTRRALVQAAGVVTAVGVVSAVCWMAFDQHQLRASAPHTAVLGPRPAANMSTAGSLPAPSTVASAWRSASETATPDPPGLVTSLQMVTLGASTGVPRVVAVLYVDTASTRAFAVTLTWFGTTGPGGSTRRILEGLTHYVFSQPIDAAADCGGAVIVTATADGLSTSQSTTAGPCPTSSTPQPAATGGIQ